MNDFLLSILLGVVEGLTEFLPVSSTAHLRIVEALLRLDLHDAYWKMYTIVIQLGAILALPVYFWNRILKFLSTFPRGASGDRNIFTHPLGLTIIAFVITAVPAFLLKKQIGLAQITSAVFPGTSRSMSTIAAGQLAGLSRSAALEFSFFLSMPTMVVATGYDLLKTLRHGGDETRLAPLVMTGHNWVVLMIGAIVSFVVALGVVAWFMNWVRARGFAPFAIYRIVLAVVLFALLMRGLI